MAQRRDHREHTARKHKANHPQQKRRLNGQGKVNANAKREENRAPQEDLIFLKEKFTPNHVRDIARMQKL